MRDTYARGGDRDWSHVSKGNVKRDRACVVFEANGSGGIVKKKEKERKKREGRRTSRTTADEKKKDEEMPVCGVWMCVVVCCMDSLYNMVTQEHLHFLSQTTVDSSLLLSPSAFNAISPKNNPGISLCLCCLFNLFYLLLLLSSMAPHLWYKGPRFYLGMHRLRS